MNCNKIMNTKNTLMPAALLMAVMFFTLPMKAQVTIGALTAPQPFSLLEITTANKTGGLRLPQLSTADRDALDLSSNPDAAHGLMIYNTDIDCVEYWNGTSWISLCEILPLTQPNPQNAAICKGERYTFNLGPATGGSGAISYQWQSSSNGLSYGDILLAKNMTFQTPAMNVPGTYFYRRVATSADFACPVTSAPAILTVNDCTPTPGATVYNCDGISNPNFHRNGSIIYNSTNLDDITDPTMKPSITIVITNTSQDPISGTITATGGGLTFTGPDTTIAPGANAEVKLIGSGTCTAPQGSDIQMLWSVSGFSMEDSSGNLVNNTPLCGFTVPVGLGEARILFLDNDNNGDQTWGPGGPGIYNPNDKTTASIRSMAIIGALQTTTSAPPGSANFGTTTGINPYIPVKFVPYNDGIIQGGGYILKANNASDALLISNQISNAVNDPNIPNPNVMIYATENYTPNISGGVSSMINGGGWIIYTTKNSFLGNNRVDLGLVMTDAGFPATSGETPLVNIVAPTNPTPGSAAEKILKGPFGDLRGQTITFTDGNAPLSGVQTLPANCEEILPPVNGYYVCFICTNPTTKSGMIVLGKSMGAGLSSTTSTPSVYDSANYKPLSNNAILEMNALAYALEQSVANDVDDR